MAFDSIMAVFEACREILRAAPERPDDVNQDRSLLVGSHAGIGAVGHCAVHRHRLQYDRPAAPALSDEARADLSIGDALPGAMVEHGDGQMDAMDAVRRDATHVHG